MSLIPISPVPSKSPRSRAGSTVDGERGTRLSTVSVAGESNLEEFAACKSILQDLVKNGGESREPLSKVLAAYEKMFSLLDTEAAMPRLSEAAMPRLSVSSSKATLPQELSPISADVAAQPSGAASPQSPLQEPSSPSVASTKPERRVPRPAEPKELSQSSGDVSAKPIARHRKVVRQIDMKEVFSPPVPSASCREPPLDAQRASVNSRNTPSPRENMVPDAHRGVCASRIVDVVDASACRRPIRGDRAQRGSEVSPHRLSRGKACPTSPLVSRNNVSFTAASRARQPVVVLPVSALAETSLRMSRSTPSANAHRVLSPEHQRPVYGSGEVFRPPTNKVSLPVREGVLSAGSPSPSNAVTTSVGGLETTGRSAEQAKAAEVQNAKHRARSETIALRRGVQPVRSHGASGLKTPSKSFSHQLGMMTLGGSPTSFPRQTGSEFA